MGDAIRICPTLSSDTPIPERGLGQRGNLAYAHLHPIAWGNTPSNGLGGRSTLGVAWIVHPFSGGVVGG